MRLPRLLSLLLAAALLLVGLGGTTTPRPALASPPLCRPSPTPPWDLHFGDFSADLPTPTPVVPSPQVRYSAHPSQAVRVLVDQPSGTIFALSDGGSLLSRDYTDYKNSGLLSVLSGATTQPSPWFGTTTASDTPPYVVGRVIPLADGQGRVYFSCGGRLYQLSAAGTPQPAPVASLPSLPPPVVWDLPVAVDTARQRLFTLDGRGNLLGYDLQSGKQLFSRSPSSIRTGVPTLAVDGQAGRVIAATYDSTAAGAFLSATVSLLDEQGRNVRTLPHLGLPAAQLLVAGSARRALLFGCEADPYSHVTFEFLRELNLSTGTYVTPQRLLLGSCGTAWNGSLLLPQTPGIVAVDAGAGTAVVVSDTWLVATGPLQLYPGFAWFISLRTGRLLTSKTLDGCVLVGEHPMGVAIDSRLHRAYVASLADGLVTVLDTRTMQVLGVVTVGGAPTSIAVDTRDQRVVVALEGAPGQTGTPGGLAWFPAAVTFAHPPATVSCAGADYSTPPPYTTPIQPMQER